LFHEHVAVSFAYHQVVVTEEAHQVQSVDLAAAACVDSLECIHGQELGLLSEDVLLEVGFADRQDLLGYYLSDEVLGF
jgi:hypothetical protein